MKPIAIVNSVLKRLWILFPLQRFLQEIGSRRLTDIGLLVMVLSVAGASTTWRVHEALPLAWTVAFWVGLAAILAGERIVHREIWPLLPLLLLYFWTFSFDRETAYQWDHLFNSDTARYLLEARRWVIEPRHFGFPVITFGYSYLQWKGDALTGYGHMGRDFLVLQVSAAGMLSVALLYHVLRRVETKRSVSLLFAYAFALSLAVWAFSSVVETYMLSTMFFLLSVHFAVSQDPAAASASARLGLVTVLALSMSLENVYLAVLFAVAQLRRTEAVGRAAVWKPWVRYALIVGVMCGGLLFVLERQLGPDFYGRSRDSESGRRAANLVEYLDYFTRDYLDSTSFWSLRELRDAVIRQGLISVVAQPDAHPRRYYVDRMRLANASNLIYLGLLAPLLGAAVRGHIRAPVPGRCLAVRMLLSALAVRFFFQMMFCREFILFTTPSLAALWMLMAMGVDAEVRCSPSRKWGIFLRGVAFLLVVWLLLNNARYFWAIQEGRFPAANAPLSGQAILLRHGAA